MRYYDVQKNWRKVKQHIEHPDVYRVLVADFTKFTGLTYGNWRSPVNLRWGSPLNLAYRAAILRASEELPKHERGAFLRQRLAQLRAEQARANNPTATGRFPADFETVDWRCDPSRRGRPPAFWRYVYPGACFWLVNFNLKLAQRVEPSRKWRIVHSAEHATVWDGEETLFDMNFLALGIEPDECFALANKGQLKPGQLRPCLRFWRREARQRK